jgi:hypothetical protein
MGRRLAPAAWTLQPGIAAEHTVGLELVRGGEAGVQGHARADQGDLVAGALAQHPGAVDRERLARSVRDRVGAARRRIYATPSRSAIACTSAAALVASLGYSTVEP